MSAAQANFEQKENEVIELRLESTTDTMTFETACRIVSALAAKLEFITQSNLIKRNHLRIRGTLDLVISNILSVVVNIAIYINISNNNKNMTVVVIIINLFLLLMSINYLVRARKSFKTAIEKHYEAQLISESEEILNHGHFLVEKTRLEHWQKLELSLHLQRAENALSQLRTSTKKS